MRDFKTIILFLVFIGIALFALYILYAQHENERSQATASASSAGEEPQSAPAAHKDYPQLDAAERKLLNEQLGLPADFPIEVIPLYGGMQVLETETGEAQSTDGEPMQRWLVRGQSVADQKDITDYYKEQMRRLQFAQTMYVSKPGEHGVDFGMNYADENYEVKFEIERRREDTETRIRIEVFRVVSASSP